MTKCRDRLFVAFTCDTEFTPPWNEGSWQKMSPWTFEMGIEEIYSILDKFGIKGTFFCQGVLVKSFPQHIKRLHKRGNLIGSHGYNHENMGARQVKVWTNQKPVWARLYKDKIKLLKMSLKEITDAIGVRPKAFVAPFDNINTSLLKILDNLGFMVDCSYNNYMLGLSSFPFKPVMGRRILEIPLSVSDFGRLGKKNILEAFTYNREMAIECIKNTIDTERKKLPFVIFLITCHPYEFTDINVPHPRDVLIVGREKTKALSDLLEFFRVLDANFLNVLEIKRLWEKYY